ncbi:putative sigma-54 modulation protein [Desulfocicer vacuolatum DSM 3385]|uniref:Ribosome hibernation promoting factor n=1 Tax=Desulfocicer vacuolatum DSM 3385 TaxID=1121400 RepID=A0A1W2CEI6_9BACT|nr:ribosome-associated translation inhibitor RaiA [Desulfocicer vacuolatum]SMC83623.1 putative sigma-54 modulation protein [Desulfocicer vacuolatum DSM 3385]
MNTAVTFKRIDPSDALKSYVQKKMDRLDKMLENPAEASVVLSVEKIRHIAEITLICDKMKLHARESSENMYSSIDLLVDKLKAQIKKNKEKSRRHMSGNKQSIKDEDLAFVSPAIPDPQSPGPAPEGTPGPEVVLESINVKPMDVDDAVTQLTAGDDDFFVFSNARTERVNVLYRRNDGNLGLIQPHN